MIMFAVFGAFVGILGIALILFAKPITEYILNLYRPFLRHTSLPVASPAWGIRAVGAGFVIIGAIIVTLGVRPL